jgi:hypothetical protein
MIQAAIYFVFENSCKEAVMMMTLQRHDSLFRFASPLRHRHHHPLHLLLPDLTVVDVKEVRPQQDVTALMEISRTDSLLYPIGLRLLNHATVAIVVMLSCTRITIPA